MTITYEGYTFDVDWLEAGQVRFEQHTFGCSCCSTVDKLELKQNSVKEIMENITRTREYYVQRAKEMSNLLDVFKMVSAEDIKQILLGVRELERLWSEYEWMKQFEEGKREERHLDVSNKWSSSIEVGRSYNFKKRLLVAAFPSTIEFLGIRLPHELAAIKEARAKSG